MTHCGNNYSLGKVRDRAHGDFPRAEFRALSLPLSVSRKGSFRVSRTGSGLLLDRRGCEPPRFCREGSPRRGEISLSLWWQSRRSGTRCSRQWVLINCANFWENDAACFHRDGQWESRVWPISSTISLMMIDDDALPGALTNSVMKWRDVNRAQGW